LNSTFPLAVPPLTPIKKGFIFWSPLRSPETEGEWHKGEPLKVEFAAPFMPVDKRGLSLALLQIALRLAGFRKLSSVAKKGW
jgi:hypothetical protein